MARGRGSAGAALTLFLIAPLVAEYLLGNISLKLLPLLLVLAPSYGGGAVLIREAARTSGRGWPSILLLGAAYALLAEGFVTQSLFNPDYLRLHLHFLSHGWIPALGMGAWWTVFMLNLHTFWSMGVSIALVEGLFPKRAATPWLGWIGKTVFGAVFVAGSATIARFTVKQEHFMASQAQFLGTGAAILVLVAAAFLWPRAEGPAVSGTQARNAWMAGLVAFVLGMLVLLVPSGWNWGAAAAQLAIDAAFLGFVGMVSRSAGWRPLPVFALGAGGALAYGVHAFWGTPSVGGGGMAARLGNGVFLALAVGTIAVGARRTARAA